jgi:hypothetical protein
MHGIRMHTVDRMHGKGKDRKTTCTCSQLQERREWVKIEYSKIEKERLHVVFK